MTAYNRQEFIAEAVQSVLSSTYKDFELVIVDDNSTDNTVAIVREYANMDPRIRLYVNEKNIGDYPNRNKAASYAVGKYLKYVDSDDYIYPWGLELMVHMMEQFPESGWGLCSLEPDIKRPFPFEFNPSEAYKYNYFGPGLFHKAPLSSIIKREVFDESGGFKPGRMVGDFELWHRLALRYKVLLMPGGMVWSRKHDDQEVKSYSQFFTQYEEITIRYLKSDECPLDKKMVSGILKNGRRRSGSRLLKVILKADRSRIKGYWNVWRSYFRNK
jgi:glycosyltransferase involved in cell wall biosynthesis